MLNGSASLTAVRRRDPAPGSNLSVAQSPIPTSATPILQMLMAEVVSLRQQVGALTVARPRPLERTDSAAVRDDIEPATAIKPRMLTRIFD
jgi:hypothetical protein